MEFVFTPSPIGSVALSDGLFKQRFDLNHRYLHSLRTENLLQNHCFEAGLWAPPEKPGDIHWGWESPNSMVRSHFVGHWIAASARVARVTNDAVLAARVREVVGELGKCQQRNGGEWVFGIPEKYLRWIQQGEPIWAPHYIAHTTLMGLVEAYRLLDIEEALEIVINAGRWFSRWLGAMSPEQLDELLDFETHAMLELWCDVYAITGSPEHADLVERYYRRRLFDPLLKGEDVLTNQHANMTIPEVHGAARAYEVTGEQRWRDIVEAYWDQAVDLRGGYATGGQTCAEVWGPPHELSARLSDKTQEHCTVFNMNRLAAYLLRWTGDARFADYRERNLVNGILAAQHPTTGMVTYYLPLRAGGRKVWSTPTESFWCCVATMVQAHAAHADDVWYTDANGDPVLAQYVGSTFACGSGSAKVVISQSFESRPGEPGKADYSAVRPVRRPDAEVFEIDVRSEAPREFTLTLRLPWWQSAPATAVIDGETVPLPLKPGAFHPMTQTWSDNHIRLEIPKRIVAEPLPDMPGTVAFLDGPVVLAGLCDHERTLRGDLGDPTTMLTPDAERSLDGHFNPHTYRTRGIDHGFRFVPLYDVADEPYSVYFPVTP